MVWGRIGATETGTEIAFGKGTPEAVAVAVAVAVTATVAGAEGGVLVPRVDR